MIIKLLKDQILLWGRGFRKIALGCGKAAERLLVRQPAELFQIVIPRVFPELYVNKFGIAAGFDKARVTELFQVVGERGSADWELAPKHRARSLLFAGRNAPQDLVPARVGQSFADAGEGPPVHTQIIMDRTTHNDRFT